MTDHIYQFSVVVPVKGSCGLYVRLRNPDEGCWHMDALITEGDFAKFGFQANKEWQNTVDPDYVPPGHYKRSVPFTGFMATTADIDAAVWRVASAFATHYQTAFGATYGIKVVWQRAYDPVIPTEGPDPYELASREADALQAMDELEPELEQLQLQACKAVQAYNAAVANWQELNSRCTRRRRRRDMHSEWRIVR